MEQKQSQQMLPILRMEQAILLEMPDDDFNKLVSEIEQSQLFQQLYRKQRLIRYQRLAGTNISSSFYSFKEDIAADNHTPDIESLLLDKEHIISQVQRLGQEKFKRYFLFPESGMTLEEIAEACGLDISKVQEINNLIDQLSIMSEFFHPSRVTTAGIRYSKVASVEKGEAGFVIGYYSPSLARGRYSIDYERLAQLEATGSLTKLEAREARQLFKKLELLNSRKDSLTKILQGITDKQALYLDSGNMKSLLPFSQKELAARTGLAASTVSRTIRGKSLDTPWGEEVPLKDFFPGPKRFRQELLRQLVQTDSELSSDEVIRTKLRERFGVAISRRSVANLRKGLKIPAAKRKTVSSEERQ